MNPLELISPGRMVDNGLAARILILSGPRGTEAHAAFQFKQRPEPLEARPALLKKHRWTREQGKMQPISSQLWPPYLPRAATR